MAIEDGQKQSPGIHIGKAKADSSHPTHALPPWKWERVGKGKDRQLWHAVC